jgi:glucose/arabinose dehydrogenase
MQPKRLYFPIASGVFAALLALPSVAANNVVANPICPDNTANFNPTLPPSIDLPPGFTASVFASGLNFPTGIAFLGDSQTFQVFVLESGHGLGGSRCNEQGDPIVGGTFSSTNPFTPDILVFNRNGKLIRGPLASPPPAGAGSSPQARRSTSRLSTASRAGRSSRPTPISQLTAVETTTVPES